jgi:hypothetical protein
MKEQTMSIPTKAVFQTKETAGIRALRWELTCVVYQGRRIQKGSERNNNNT